MRPDPLKFPFPQGVDKKVLLHACCAPCSGSIIKRMVDAELEPTVFFYNPNIYPRAEYEKRKAEVVRYTVKLSVPFVDWDYEQLLWLEAARDHENDPERGGRCSICFDMRLRQTAAYAAKNGFRIFTTSLGIARWKDFDQVTRAGIKAASLFPGLTYWAMDWRKDGGSEMMSRITKEEGFYRQKYCGCIYSLQALNAKKAKEA